MIARGKRAEASVTRSGLDHRYADTEQDSGPAPRKQRSKENGPVFNRGFRRWRGWFERFLPFCALSAQSAVQNMASRERAEADALEIENAFRIVALEGDGAAERVEFAALALAGALDVFRLRIIDGGLAVDLNGDAAVFDGDERGEPLRLIDGRFIKIDHCGTNGQRFLIVREINAG